MTQCRGAFQEPPRLPPRPPVPCPRPPVSSPRPSVSPPRKRGPSFGWRRGRRRRREGQTARSCRESGGRGDRNRAEGKLGRRGLPRIPIRARRWNRGWECALRSRRNRVCESGRPDTQGLDFGPAMLASLLQNRAAVGGRPRFLSSVGLASGVLRPRPFGSAARGRRSGAAGAMERRGGSSGRRPVRADRAPGGRRGPDQVVSARKSPPFDRLCKRLKQRPHIGSRIPAASRRSGVVRRRCGFRP